MTKSYWLKKLVRDKSSERMQAAGARVVSHTLDENEFLGHLAEKLREEADELAAARTTDEKAEELADILEIVDASLAAIGFSAAEVRALQDKKRAERGGFAKREFVDYIETPEDSTFDVYCAAAPDKYPVRSK